MYGGGGGLLLGGVGGGNAAKTKSVVLTSNRRKGKVTEYLLLEQAYVAELKKCIDSYVQPLRAQWEQFVQVLGDHHRYIAAEGGYEVEEEDQNAATDTIANAFRSGFEELEAMHSLHLDLLTRIKEVAAPPPPPPAMSPRRELAASSEDAGSASSPRSQFPPPPPSGPPPSASSSGPALPPGPPSRLPPYIRTIHIVQEKSPELLSLYRSYQSNYFTFASTIRELKHNTAFSELLVRSEEETQQPTPPPPQEDTEQVVPETQQQNEEEDEGPKAEEQAQEGQQEEAKEESVAEVPPPLPPRRSPSQAALALMGVMENAFHRPLECFERYPILLLDLIELKNEVRGHSSTSPLVQLSALSASKGRRKRRGTTGNETTEEEEEEATEKEDRPLFRLVRAMRRLLKEMRRTEGIDVSDDDDSDSDSDSETETETETETEKEEEGVEQQHPRTVGEAEAGEGEVDSTSDHDHQASEEAVPTSPHEHQHSVSALPATDAQQATNGEGEHQQHQTVGPVTPPNRRLSRLAEPDDSVLGGGSSGGSSDEEGSGGSGIFSASGKQRTRRGSLLSMSHKKERKEKKERKKEEKKERKEKKKTEKKEKKERRKSIGKSQNSGKLLTRALSTNTLPSNTETYKQGAARFDQTRTLGRSDSVGPSMLMRSLHNSSNNKEPTSPEGTAVRRKSILPPHLQEPNEQQEQHEQHEHEETTTAEEEEDGNKPEEEPLPSEAQNDEEHQQQQPIDESECKTPEQPKKMTPFEWRTTIANEILTTERTYVAQLTRLLTEYISPLRRLSEMTGGKSIKMEELNKIFSNVELILNVNKELLAGLEERIGNNWNETAVFGDVFLDMAPFLKLYSQYSKDHEDANKTLIACQEKYPEFKQFLERKMGQDISAFLILPIQRIPRYLLLLKDLIRRTDPSHSDYDKLQAAYEKVKEVADFINENIRKAEAMNKIIEIEKKLEGNPESLVIPSRRYVREGAFQEISNKGLRNCYLFLFNDMLLLATPQRSRYKFKTTVSLHGAQVIPAKVGFANAFGIVNGLIKHEFSAPDSNTQSMWVSDLESMADQLHKIELTKKDHQLGAELVFNMMPSSPTSAEKANRKKGSGLFGRKKKSGK
ncbi:H/ACA ribonucleoprotein complex subunit CBF5 [Balamuthia mandrillaris]